ncbi:hypothetical protein EAH87_14895 [Sphingomonas koreensis]|nr:hypothetical protein EAH87_14895 [Sphingomonas koreensis]
MKITYLVHDLGDPAVERRVRMLRAGGGDPIVLGFRRGESAPPEIAGARVVDLGQTRDSRFVQRIAMVVGALARPGEILAAAQGSEAIIGRNLETLLLANRARRAAPQAKLVYECLDIHRLLLSRSRPARLLQAIEARLLGAVELLLSSSPAFLRDYFSHRPTLHAPVLLLENKLLALDGYAPQPVPFPDGPPWVIGWFGMLRCARTFDILRHLVAKHQGRVRVEIAGRASPAVFDNFEAQVAAVPHFRFHGAYRAEDLPALYARCHFAWAIDYFEEGLNSRWLLPNRLYEAASFGVVPIALESVETGKWLLRHGAGVTLDADRSSLDSMLRSLDTAAYAILRAQVAEIPRTDLVAGQADCDVLIAALQTPGR